MSKLTARQAIAKVLSDGKSHKVPDIIKAAVPMTNLGGATPGQTIYSVLYSENKKSGNARQFVSTGRGEFKLNKSFAPATKKSTGSKTKTASAKTASAKKTTARKSSAAKKSTAKRSSSRSSGRSRAKAGAAA